MAEYLLRARSERSVSVCMDDENQNITKLLVGTKGSEIYEVSKVVTQPVIMIFEFCF